MACRSFDPGLASTSKVDFLRATLVAANLDLLVPGSLLHTVRKTEPLLRSGLIFCEGMRERILIELR